MQQTITSVRSPLSIIVPTLNEQANIKRLVERIHRSLKRERIEYEIVFVDDHSDDHTVRNIQSLAQIYPSLSVRMKQGKQGKAFSLIEGFEASKYKLVCMIDADLQYPPEAIVPMYNKLEVESADIVVTERIDQKTSKLRQLSTRVFNLIFTRMLFGISLDSQSGLKLFKKKILSTITISPSPWSFDLEFIVRALEQNYRIANHKIAFAERVEGEGKVNMLSTTIELIKSSVSLSMNSSRKKVRQAYVPPVPRQNSRSLRRGITVLLSATLLLVLASIPAQASALLLPSASVSLSVGTPEDKPLVLSLATSDESYGIDPANSALDPQPVNEPSSAFLTPASVAEQRPVNNNGGDGNKLAVDGSEEQSRETKIVPSAIGSSNSIDAKKPLYFAETGSSESSPYADTALPQSYESPIKLGISAIAAGFLLAIASTTKLLGTHLSFYKQPRI